MTIDPSEAASSLHDIAAVERRTREALFYGGSGTIFIMWGVLVACGHALAELYPRSAGITWAAVPVVGCAGTALIMASRMLARARDSRDWRIVWAVLALVIYGAVWSWLLGPVVPRQLMYVFQPSLFMLGFILAGLWVGRFFLLLGLIGLALMALGYFQAEPLLRYWMAMVQSGTLILGGIWLHKQDLWR
jgi:hypothetical protein